MAAPNWDELSPNAPEAQPEPSQAPQAQDPNAIPSWDDLETPDEHFGSTVQQAITALEQLASGATLGASKIAETKLLGVKPEDIEARSSANPVTSIASNIAGIAGLLSATGGLGLAPEAGAGVMSTILSNAAQGSAIAAANAANSDLAFGDPNLTASKLISDIGISSVYGGLTGGVTSALLSGGGSGLKSLVGKVKDGVLPDLAANPESLGWADKFRMGLFSGLSSPEAKQEVASTVAKGMDSLNNLTSMENLGLTTDPSAAEQVKNFDSARKFFLKEFGDVKEGKIDPEEVMSFITNPYSKASNNQTMAFNHYMKAIKDLSEVSLKEPNLDQALQEAKGSLNDWMDLIPYANETAPHSDIEYGSPGNARPYSTKFDLPPGEIPKEAGRMEGVTIGSGELTARAPSFGSERVSPFEQPESYVLNKVKNMNSLNQMIEDYRGKIADLLEKQEEPSAISAGDISSGLEDVQLGANKLKNINKSESAIEEVKNHSLGAGAGLVAAHIPYGPQILSLITAVRRYSGDGGLYRLGNDLASPIKVLDSIANVTSKVDQKIGDKARLIFTGASSQARRREK